MKNALNSVLDAVKGGVKSVYAATPPGQLASQINQAVKLMAPTVADLSNAYDQAYKGASSFVQRNPSPVSFATRQVPQIAQAPIRTISPNAYQTFQQNLKLASQPMKSLTQETPAAKFLYEKIGGPGVDNLQGPKTVGKYIAGVTEDSLMSPALIPMMSGGKIANVLKEGVNTKAALKSGAALSALTSALSKLKGEEVKPSDIATNFALGSVFGLLEPKPMEGLATTELASARKTLGKYGFELKDFSNPESLKAKWKSSVMELHPDRGGNAEEFKAFIDAYNKATSANINPSWNLSNMVDWIKNIWSKKEPIPQEAANKGSILPITKETPPTVTTGAQNTINADTINSLINDRFGKTLETANRSQITDILNNNPTSLIPHNDTVLQKLTSPKKAIDTKIFDLADDGKSRQALGWGGASRHLMTDGYIAILDPNAADSVNNKLINDTKVKFTRELLKINPKLSLKSAEQTANEAITNLIDKYKKENFPNIQAVIPQDPGLPATIQGYTVLETNGSLIVTLTNGEQQTSVDLNKLSYVRSLFPNAEIRFFDSNKPISFVENGEIKALVMPVRVKSHPFPIEYVPPQPVAQKESKPIEQKPKYDYQSTQLDIPPEIGNKIQEFGNSIPIDKLSIDPKTGMGGVERDPHVTVLYGLDKKITPDQIQSIVAGQPPIPLTLGKVSIFSNDDMDVLKVDVSSPELNALNKKIESELGAPGNTFKEYKPHVTIAYLKKGEGKPYEGSPIFEGQQIQLNNLTFSGQNGEKVVIPLTGQQTPSTVITEAQKPIIDSISMSLEEIINKISTGSEFHGGRGIQGMRLNEQELNTLFQYVKSIDTPENKKWSGKIVKTWTGDEDLIIGIVKEKDGKNSFLVTSFGNKHPEYKGVLRLHRTPISQKEIVGDINQTSNVVENTEKSIEPISITPAEQPAIYQITSIEPTTQETPKEKPKVDFTANDIELYNRLYTQLGEEMFKETHRLGFKGGSYTMKKMSSIEAPSKTNPEIVKRIVTDIQNGKSFMPPHIEEIADKKYIIVSNPEAYDALKELGYKFIPSVDVTGEKGFNTNWDEGSYNYDPNPYRKWNESGAGNTYQEPPQPAPPKPKPIEQVIKESRLEEKAKENQPKFFSLWDKAMFEVASNLRPAKVLDRKVFEKGGTTKAEYEFMMNQNRIPAYKDMASQEMEKALKPILDKNGKFTDDAELYMRAQQYIYRESVLMDRAQKMMSSIDPKVVERGKQLMEEVNYSRVNEGNQTAESARKEIDDLKERLGEEKFNIIQKTIDEKWHKIIMDAEEFLYKSGMIKPSTHEELNNRKEGQYAPYKTIKYIRDNPPIERVDKDGNPIKTMWGTESLQTNPIMSTIKYVLNAYRVGWENRAKQELYKAKDFAPEFVGPVRIGKPNPDGTEETSVYIDGVQKRFYVPKEILQMYEFAPMPDEMRKSIARFLLKKSKQGFVFFVTATRMPFAAVNFVNDILRLANISKYGVTFANPVATAQFVVDVLNGTFQSALSNIPEADKIKIPGIGNIVSQRVRSLKNRGVLGSTHTSFLADIARDEDMQYKFLEKSLGSKIYNFALDLAKYVSAVSEDASKIVGDIRGERAGDPFEVRDVETKRYAGSPNFGEVGRTIRNESLNLAIPFLNPAIQGTRLDIGRIVEGGAKGSKESRAARFRILTNLIVVTLLSYAWRKNAEWKDDFDKERANNPQLFDDNIVIPFRMKGTRPDGTEGWRYITIPLKDTSRNINAFLNGALDLAYERNPQAFEDFVYQSFVNWLPVQTRWSKLSEIPGFIDKAKAVSKDMLYATGASLNSLIRTIPEQMMNTKLFTRTPIVSGYNQKAPSGEQFNPTTPLIYKKIGQVTGLSPVRMQYLGEQIGGSQITDMAKYLSKGLYGETTSLPINNQSDAIAQDPIGRRFLGVLTGEDRENQGSFYKVTGDIAEIRTQAKRLEDRNDPRLDSYLQAHPELEYADDLAKLKSKMDNITGEQRKMNYNVLMTPEERKAATLDFNQQKQDVYQEFNSLLGEINKIKPTAVPMKTSLLGSAQAAETTPNGGFSIMKSTSPLIKLREAKTLTDKAIAIKSVQSKYKDINDAMDKYIETGKDTAKRSLDRAIQKSGFTEEESTYAYWSDQNNRLKRAYIETAINDLSGNELLQSLAKMRKVSPITEKQILTDELINNLVDEKIISKYEGKQLKSIKTDSLTQKMKISSGGSVGTTKAQFSKLKTLYENRNKAAYKPIKLKKISPPKLKSIGTISGGKLKAKSLGSISKLKLRVPKIAKFKIPKTFRKAL